MESEGVGVFDFCGREFSDVGGDGGVGVSDAADELDLAGGVAIVGEEAVVTDARSDNGD